ncbi:MAG: crossover junction endodeoxyribonuclease RuvC [Brevinema sp.]
MEKKLMIICGLDPGFDRLGYAFLQLKTPNATPQVLSYGLITTPKTSSFDKRLLELSQDFDHLLTQYKPDAVYMESLYMGRNVTTVLFVAEVRGVLRYLTAKNSISMGEIPPNTVKKTVSGYGAADKSQMVRAITALLQLPAPPKPDDVADALAVALCGSLKTPLK